MKEQTWQERLWDRFKSPLGYSSIDNKNNSMYDLEKFITELIAKTREETIREVLELVRDLDIFGYPATTKEEYKEMLNDILNKLKK
jgi:hypothetical protein